MANTEPPIWRIRTRQLGSAELPDWRFILYKNTHIKIYRFRFKKIQKTDWQRTAEKLPFKTLSKILS